MYMEGKQESLRISLPGDGSQELKRLGTKFSQDKVVARHMNGTV